MLLLRDKGERERGKKGGKMFKVSSLRNLFNSSAFPVRPDAGDVSLSKLAALWRSRTGSSKGEEGREKGERGMKTGEHLLVFSLERAGVPRGPGADLVSLSAPMSRREKKKKKGNHHDPNYHAAHTGPTRDDNMQAQPGLEEKGERGGKGGELSERQPPTRALFNFHPLSEHARRQGRGQRDGFWGEEEEGKKREPSERRPIRAAHEDWPRPSGPR